MLVLRKTIVGSSAMQACPIVTFFTLFLDEDDDDAEGALMKVFHKEFTSLNLRVLSEGER